MLTGRIAVLENNGNAIDELALAELSRGGFVCGKLVLDGLAPKDLLATGYHVLIARLSSPLDSELRWMTELADLEQSFPLILVSEPEVLPSLGCLLERPSVEWLMAPCNPITLCNRARKAVDIARLSVLLAPDRQATCGAEPISVGEFLEQALKNAAAALRDIQHVTETLTVEDRGRTVCHLFDCPRIVSLTDAVRDAIHVLEKTKSSFKSKELAELRRRLQAVLKSA
ncbi:MAG TPA: hypothetical protein PLP42_22175 [Acidobacteriota bacterium]|nr:hypothetical protein [Acidobacteriota bacterium]